MSKPMEKGHAKAGSRGGKSQFLRVSLPCLRSVKQIWMPSSPFRWLLLTTLYYTRSSSATFIRHTQVEGALELLVTSPADFLEEERNQK